jgi:hypothetical protein
MSLPLRKAIGLVALFGLVSLIEVPAARAAISRESQERFAALLNHSSPAQQQGSGDRGFQNALLAHQAAVHRGVGNHHKGGFPPPNTPFRFMVLQEMRGNRFELGSTLSLLRFEFLTGQISAAAFSAGRFTALSVFTAQQAILRIEYVTGRPVTSPTA